MAHPAVVLQMPLLSSMLRCLSVLIFILVSVHSFPFVCGECDDRRVFVVCSEVPADALQNRSSSCERADDALELPCNARLHQPR